MKMTVPEKLKLWGTMNIMSPYLLYSFTAIWSIFIMFLFGFDDSSVVATAICVAPMLVCPISCVLGIIYGLKNRRIHRKEGLRCVLFSLGGLVGLVVFTVIMAWLSSIG